MDTSASHIDVAVPVEGVAGGGTAYGWSDTGICDPRPLRGRIDPSKVPCSDLVHVWGMPSTTNVGPHDMPRPLEPISLLAARNERESVQLAIRPKVSWGTTGVAGSVQIQCTDLASSSGDRLVVGESLTFRQVVTVLGVPDALVPLNTPACQLNIFPGETTAIWVSIGVPSGQPPGQYEGEITITALKTDAESTSHGSKQEKFQVFQELKDCLDVIEHVEGKPVDEVVNRVKSATSSIRRVLLSPSFADLFSENGPVDMMDEDAIVNLSVKVKLSLTVWDFVLPATPSLPAVIGISDTVIEDRFGVEHGSSEWYELLDQHFRWLLSYRISPYFCRWGDGMRVLTYTCPWPADHPKSDEYYSDPRLAAYAVPYRPVVSCGDTTKESLQREVELLRSKAHWRKAYFYLWDEPLNVEHFEAIRSMASEIHDYAPDARILTTYYCGPSDAPLASSNFEAFLKVPEFLRPHNQIYCTSEWVIGNREDLVKDIVTEIQPENGITMNSCWIRIAFIPTNHSSAMNSAILGYNDPLVLLLISSDEWWSYVCMAPTDPHPNWHLGMRGTQHRAVMWRVWKEGGTGFLYWGANCYEKATVPSAEIQFRRGLPPGDGVLFYPGQVFSSSHEPVASLRLERLLSGLQDIEYLKLYASRYGRNEGLNLLEKTGMYLGPERYTSEHVPVDIMRGEIYRTCQSQ